MTIDLVRQIVDAVVYEGYALWPYRRSAIKNQQRWTFGGVYPAVYSATTGGTDRSFVQTQCVVRGRAGSAVAATIRFLHVVHRQVLEVADGHDVAVDALEMQGRRYVTWDETTEREIELAPLVLAESASDRIVVDIPAGEHLEELDGGALLRSWRDLRAAIETRVERVTDDVYRVTVRISNEHDFDGVARDDAVRHTLVSTHTILHSSAGGLVSNTDPPAGLAEVVASCDNIGTWPVLVGEPGDDHTILSSPIILYDYPQIAPESPGDLFDGCEIDQLLVLNILGLTDEEKREMADSDPRTKAILERTLALTPDDMLKLHGTFRDVRPVDQ